MPKPKLVSLSLKNFMAHRELSVKFCDGMNAITGHNNAGKTTLIRALRFLAFDFSLARDRLITYGEKECEVRAEFSDGSWVSRRIGTGVNEFKSSSVVLQNPTPDAIQTQIVPMLREVGLAPMTSGKKSWWPQFQTSGQYFLVRDTPQGVASILGVYSSSDVFLGAMKAARKSVTSLAKELDTHERRLSELRDSRKTLGNVIVAAEAMVEEINRLDREVLERSARIKSVEAAIRDARTLTEELGDGLDPDDLRRVLEKLGKGRKDLASLDERVREISFALDDVRKASGEVTSAEAAVQTARNEKDEAVKAALAGGVCPLCGSKGVGAS